MNLGGIGREVRLPMSERAFGELEALCYMVARGGKPAANIALQDRYLAGARTLIERHGLRSYTEDLEPGWKTVWVYRFPHILDVIQTVRQAPRTVFDHWVLGKLFGYSEEAIQAFVASADLSEGRSVAAGAGR